MPETHPGQRERDNDTVVQFSAVQCSACVGWWRPEL